MEKTRKTSREWYEKCNVATLMSPQSRLGKISGHERNVIAAYEHYVEHSKENVHEFRSKAYNSLTSARIPCQIMSSCQ
jgi:hypothetical protein